jgi:hypothetical protein
MGIPAVGPVRHLLFVQLTVSSLQDRAKLGEIALNLIEILHRDLRPRVFQWSPELFPELSELLLIHHLLLG